MLVEKHQFIDGLEDKGASLACPFCGNKQWNLLIDEPIDMANQQLLNFTLVAPNRRDGVTQTSVVAMICKCCGFLRQHSLSVFAPASQ
ncbi:hypothetical protein IAE57_12530 [Stenotrophomonas sp. S48]|uniref:hypothetical protein n=1 Tax=unclassified Stenotrophomonas TaxID=196198 RepID=UPI0019016F8D|nr:MULTISPECIES: hypothetical protein [unclassified Stenotrophomonas]MBK0026993.1 hypothetical protein [Stenotrophomonas sp. S48]MBK0048566.1 hypothetical protein [Stenotrophomonas sp. S49]